MHKVTIHYVVYTEYCMCLCVLVLYLVPIGFLPDTYSICNGHIHVCLELLPPSLKPFPSNKKDNIKKEK